MPVVKLGEKLPSASLEKIKFTANLSYRIHLLHMDPIAMESHWVGNSQFPNIPDDYKGKKQCIRGMCCKCTVGIVGRMNQEYVWPIWEYTEPNQSANGQVKALVFYKQDYDLLIAKEKMMNQAGRSLSQVDIIVNCTPSSNPKYTSPNKTFDVAPDNNDLTKYFTAEMAQKVQESVAFFYSDYEGMDAKPMSEQAWWALIQGVGEQLAQTPQLGFQPQLPVHPPQQQLGFQQQSGFPPQQQGFPGTQPGAFPPQQQQAVFPQAQQQGFPGAGQMVTPPNQGATGSNGFPGVAAPSNIPDQVMSPEELAKTLGEQV